MAKICFITGKKVMFGNNVSHSNRKTRRKFMPNLHKLRIWIPEQNKFIKLKLSSKGLKIINKIGFTNSLKKIKHGKKN